MKQQDKVILICAITGAIHTPSMSPYLPVTPEQIAEVSIKAAEAGASIIHLHARDPEDAFPSTDPDHYEPFLQEIKANTNATINITINITTGQRSRRAMMERKPELAFEDRMLAPMKFAPEIVSFNMGR